LGRSRELVLAALGDHKPKSQRQIVKITGLSEGSARAESVCAWTAGNL